MAKTQKDRLQQQHGRPARTQESQCLDLDEDPQGFRVLVPAYLEWMAVSNYSPETIRNRKMYLRYFAEWCAQRGLREPSEITKPILERYRRHLFHYRKKADGRPLAFQSQHARLVPIRAFFKWLTGRNHILHNPAAELELPKLEHRLPKHVLTSREAEQVMNQPDVSVPMGLRDRAILEVLYSTGMRRGEIVGLKLYDLDAQRGTAMIRLGKGKKDRVVPIGERALAWINKYITDVRPTLVTEPDLGVLFLTRYGKRFTKCRMTQLVRGYVDSADIGKTGACHMLRHTMATLMLENGADIRYIQQMLGHAKLETTQVYTFVSIRKLKDVHTATHPAKQKRQEGTTGGEEDLSASGEAETKQERTQDTPAREGG